MNKVIQANLAGLAFTFDDDAYATLDHYLASLNGYFRSSPGREDIMHDIEARLAELFMQNLKGRNIVTGGDVTAAIGTLGTPEQLSGINIDTAQEEATDFTYTRRDGRRGQAHYSRYGRKLMRDPDQKVLGGVCSGLSAYFGIENPVWIRLAFVVSVLGAGIGVLPYVILWIVMPRAQTAADKLAMQGAPIDLQNIAEQVEREATQIANRLNEWGEEVSRRDWKNTWKRRDWRGAGPRDRSFADNEDATV